ncbi:hypothetical protein [Bradyrhizobium arachidis]|uniref:hypothetical protein n=1 Tax=Bradyrhizobium arachidis TaxID=858423 RepID=UPI002161F323|nr:hypothetical protein [Bradyrhizobium arachidis]UVO30524.1 hypothetical protein KUF59_07585 [Bradyrhizobium arachidis]
MRLGNRIQSESLLQNQQLYIQIALGFGLVFSTERLLGSIKKVKRSVYLLKLTLDVPALLNVLGQIKLLNELLLSGEQILNDCRHLISVTVLRPIAGCCLLFTLIQRSAGRHRAGRDA